MHFRAGSLGLEFLFRNQTSTAVGTHGRLKGNRLGFLFRFMGGGYRQRRMLPNQFTTKRDLLMTLNPAVKTEVANLLIALG